MFRERVATLRLPKQGLVVGRGLLYPEILQIEPSTGESRSLLVLPPRYRTHEEAMAGVYGLEGVRDVGLLKGPQSRLGLAETPLWFPPEDQAGGGGGGLSSRLSRMGNLCTDQGQIVVGEMEVHS